MNPMLDYCFTSAPQQTITHTGIKKLLWIIKKTSSRKVIPI